MISSFVHSQISLDKARPIQVIKAFGPTSIALFWVPECQTLLASSTSFTANVLEFELCSASLASIEHIARTMSLIMRSLCRADVVVKSSSVDSRLSYSRVQHPPLGPGTVNRSSLLLSPNLRGVLSFTRRCSNRRIMLQTLLRRRRTVTGCLSTRERLQMFKVSYCQLRNIGCIPV